MYFVSIICHRKSYIVKISFKFTLFTLYHENVKNIMTIKIYTINGICLEITNAFKKGFHKKLSYKDLKELFKKESIKES